MLSPSLTHRGRRALAPSCWGLFPRLFIYLLGVAAIPLLFVSLRAEIDMRSVAVEARRVQLDALAESLGRSLDSFVAERRRDVEQVAAIPSVRRAAEGAWQEDARVHAATDALRLQVARSTHNEVAALVDRTGLIRLSSDPSLVGQNVSGWAVTQTALRGTTAVGDLLSAPEGAGRASLLAASPVMDDAGMPLAVVLYWFAPDDLWALLGGVRVGDTGFNVLVDGRGLIIGHSTDHGRLFAPFATLTGDVLAPLPSSPDQPATGALPLPVRGGLMDTFADFAAGQGQAVAVRQLGTLPWTVVVSQAEREALAPLGAVRQAAQFTALVVLLCAALVAAAVALSIARPIGRMRGVLAAAAAGDLTQRVDLAQQDELGKLAAQVDSTLDALGHLLADASAAADAASTTSTQVSAATQQQAAAIAEISTTIEELARSAEQVAESADATMQTAERARGRVLAGIESLDHIKERSDMLAERLGSLVHVSQRIGDIADLIGDITNKTHLLSVNASIEAASAGEFGRRFAVVAQQVKQLADETRDAAIEVKQLIRETQTATVAAVQASEDVAREVGHGVGIAGETDRSIDHMVHQSRTISLATQQQLSANRQVADAIAGTSDAVQHVAVAVGDLESRVRSLRQRIEGLTAAPTPRPRLAEGGALPASAPALVATS